MLGQVEQLLPGYLLNDKALAGCIRGYCSTYCHNKVGRVLRSWKIYLRDHIDFQDCGTLSDWRQRAHTVREGTV